MAITLITITGTVRKGNGEAWPCAQFTIELVSTIVADSDEESVYPRGKQVINCDENGVIPTVDNVPTVAAGYVYNLTLPDMAMGNFVVPPESAPTITIDEVVALVAGGEADPTEGYTGVTLEDAAWLELAADTVPDASDLIPDAPSDGVTYGRADAAWVEVTGGGGSDYDGSDTAANIQALDPTTYLGQTWWATDEKIAYAAVTSPVVGADVWQAVGLVYNADTDTFENPPNQGGMTLNDGQEIFRTVINRNGTSATAANPKVFLSNLVDGTNPLFIEGVKAIASDISHNSVFGLNTTDALVDGKFDMTVYGRVNDVDTSAWPAGTKLYVDATTRGEMTMAEPLINAWQVAEVFVQDAVNGVLNVNTINATDLADTGSQVLQGVNVWFTGNQTTLTGGTFYEAFVEDQGTIATATQTQTVADDQQLPLAQDWVTVANTSLSPLAPGARSMIMEYITNSTAGGEKLHCEIYVADPDGNVVDSGIVDNPVGVRGVRVLMDLESPVLNTPDTNDTYFATLTTYLDEAYTLPDGYRLRFTILVEKIGTQGGGKTFTISFGNEHDTRIIGLAGISSDDVSNNAADSADNPTVTEALDNRLTIDSSIVSISAARNLLPTDAGKILECTGTFTLTAPDGLDAGFQVALSNVGAGIITIAAGTTLQAKGAAYTLANQYGMATLYHRGSNVWLLAGDLT